MSIPGTGVELLIINEPAGAGLTDRSSYLHFGDGATGLGGSERTTVQGMLKQRGVANISLNIKRSDSYLPVEGWQVYLFDLSPSSGQTIQFAGLITKVQTSWWGTNGDRLAVLSCASMERFFDTIRVPGRLYQNQTAGFIFSDLLSLASGWPGTTGTINAGPIIGSFLIEDQATIAECFDRLATQASYIWGVDITTLEINFGPPGGPTAPFALAQTDVIWEDLDFISDLTDFRNRQIIELDYDAFGRSAECFVGSGQTVFQLRNPVHDVTGCWVTKNTQNTATGTFSGQPANGDTVTIGYPTSGSSYNWAALSPYFPNYTIVDSNNNLQVCSSGGTSGASMPTWNTLYGGTTLDGTVAWVCKGPAGNGGPYNVATYTFVSVLDNRIYGQVLMGGSAAATCQNLVDAINSNTSTRGVGYSLPTWENALINADAPSGTTFTIRDKGPGKASIAALSKACSNFSWSAAQTSGGVTTFGTTQITVGPATANNGGLGYTPGSNIVVLFHGPLNSGTNLCVEYHRIDGNKIAVENTPLVAQRAAIEGGTGKYQALMSDTSATPFQGLAEANAALAAFDTVPDFLEFLTFRPGLRPNQSLDVTFHLPAGPNFESGGDSLPTSNGWFGSLVGAWCDSSGNVIQVLCLGNGPSVIVCPAGATQLQLGMNDQNYSDDTGSWTINVNGTNHTVLATAIVWNQTGGQNPAYATLQDTFGGYTSPTVITGFTAGSIATVTYVSGLVSPGGPYAQIYDANGVVGTPGGPGVGTPPNVDPGHYGVTPTGVTAWIVQEVESELMPSKHYLGDATHDYGHWRYTVRCVSAAQIGSYLDFWEGLGGGGSSITSTPAFGGTGNPVAASTTASVQVAVNSSVIGVEPELNIIGVGITGSDNAGQSVDVTFSFPGGFAQTFTSVTSVTVNHNLNTPKVIVQCYDNGSPQIQFLPASVKITGGNQVVVDFAGVSTSGEIVVMGFA